MGDDGRKQGWRKLAPYPIPAVPIARLGEGCAAPGLRFTAPARHELCVCVFVRARALLEWPSFHE